eukprot:TRINITY_DN7255_c0_g1_i1.p2 TRINITY_DN7255_c0_g1~~TRINITY_DN7255_c0_g1_i1.p2  ORF type:complete len:588 (-),score=217.21 TRINITY_DN7255_c0_g1_i1:92-1855(-)
MSAAEKAVALKDEGNTFLRQGNHTEAAKKYTEAIELDPTNQVYFSNRSAAYLSLQNLPAALKDANTAISLKPDWSKGYLRKGTALQWMSKYAEAVEAFEAGLKVEPANAPLQKALSDAKAILESTQKYDKKRQEAEQMLEDAKELFRGDVAAKIKKYTETAELAKDTEFMALVKKIKGDLDNIQSYLGDPRVGRFVSVALQYSKIERMSKSERDDFSEKQEEMRVAQLKREALADDRRRKALREKKKNEAAKKLAAELEGLTPDQLKARDLKEEGNTLYKAKELDAAFAKYSEASSLDPENLVYYSNKAAVLLEMKKYDETIKLCQEGLELGRKNFAKFSLIGRLLFRLGSAYMKKGEPEEALTYLKKSIAEDRTAATLKLLRNCEKLIDEKKKAAYLDPVKSEEAKLKGNDFFRAQKFPEAVQQYTEAIKRNPDNHALFSNRATAYTKLMAYREALKDLDKCIEMKPDFVKAYLKKGKVHQILKEYQKCLKVYEEALEYEPDNKEVANAIATTVHLINSSDGPSEEEVQRNVASDPEVQRILADPVMRQVLQDLQTDPSTLNKHMSDPAIEANINKLIAAGVIRTK